MKDRKRRFQNPTPKKENGQWKLRYRAADESGRRRLRTKCLGPDTMTPAEAKRIAVEFLKPINDGASWTRHTEKTMATLFDKWRSAVKPMLKPATASAYEWAIMRLTKAGFAKIPLSVLGADDVQELITSESRKIGPGSVRVLKANLSGLLARAKRWGWIGSNPGRGEDYDLPRYERKPRAVLSPAQVWLLAQNLPALESTLVLVAVLTGARKGELEALKWDDLSGSVLRIDESNRKGRLGTPKSRKSNRPIDLGPRALRILAEWRAQATRTDPGDFVFPTRYGKPMDLSHVMDDKIKPVCVRLGIPVVTWHCFRHTHTSWGRKAGIQAEIMRDRLGHSSVLITQDLYSHIERPEAAALIEELLPRESYPTGATATIQ